MTDSTARPARPWDLFNTNIGRVETEVATKRLEICKNCDKYIKSTTQCKACGCIMLAKAKLPNSFCPEHKWDIVRDIHTDHMDDGLSPKPE